MSSMIAIGDSLVNGRTRDVANVPGKSWARWLSETADMAYEQHAIGGYTSTQIVEELLPRVSGVYDYGVFNMGTNDVLKGIDLSVLRTNAERAAATFTSRCKRVLVLDIAISQDASYIIHQVAAEYGLTVIDSRLSGPLLFQPDGIHPTAVGHLVIADRAAMELGFEPPSSAVKVGRLGLPYFVRYGLRWTKFNVRSLIRKYV
jgi:lysophospholipase L1-like esterase